MLELRKTVVLTTDEHLERLQRIIGRDGAFPATVQFSMLYKALIHRDRELITVEFYRYKTWPIICSWLLILAIFWSVTTWAIVGDWNSLAERVRILLFVELSVLVTAILLFLLRDLLHREQEYYRQFTGTNGET